MLFNSYEFILFFLPLTVIGYWLINRYASIKYAHLFMVIMSIWFYLYADVRQLPGILISIFINYGIYKYLFGCKIVSKRKMLLTLGIVFNVGSLFYYKYAGLLFDNLNSLFSTEFKIEKIIIPLGISYIVFQQIAFLVDTYREEVEEHGFVEYLLFFLYFPKEISGPILLHTDFFPQIKNINNQKINYDNIAKGMYIFALGLGKKVLLADVFGKAVNYAFGLPLEQYETDLYALDILIVIFCYTLQLYFDFSGYCDMAIGVSKMFNIDLPLNFDSPYKALNIIDFWKRWHITLTRFLTKYVFIPLGGSRKGTLRTYVNIIIVFLISGIWHGAGWTFIVWGIMHGMFQVITKVYKKFFEKMHPALSWMITFGFVNVAWLFFRAESLKSACGMLHQLIRLNFTSISNGILEAFNLPELVFVMNDLVGIDILARYPYFFLLIYLLIGLIGVLGCSNSYEKMQNFKPSWKNTIVFSIIMIWSIFSFSGISTFLYWEF